MAAPYRRALESRIVPASLLSRRELAALAASGWLVPAAGQSQFGWMLWEFVREYLRLLDERRSDQLARLESAEEFAALRGKVRTELGRMWGPFPARTPLNAKQIGIIDAGDHRIERIVFESRPSFHVTANLYRPKGPSAKVPAIIFPCGHGSDGKASETYQLFSALMARNGIAVLTWDPLGQGERHQYVDAATGRTRFRAGSGEHRILGDRCYLVGENLMQYRVWDCIRALDYLESRQEIESERIGIAGQSGGGMVTLQFAGFEDRLKAAFVSCAVASFRAKSEALLIADPEQVLYGTLRAGIDHPELLAAFAPRPLMIGAAKRDYVPIEGARRTHAELTSVYEKLAAPEQLHLVETDDTHGLNRELREAAASFFLATLAGEDRAVSEGDSRPRQPGELACTESGQVAVSLQSKSVADLCAAKADAIEPSFELPRSESEFGVYQSLIANRIKDVTRVGSFKAEFGIEVPTRFLDAGVYAKGAVFLVAEQGKDHPIVQRYLIDAVVAANHSVYGLDLRGWGASRPVMPELEVGFEWDDFLAYRSLELGRPLFGQRLKDLLATAPRLTKRRDWIVIGVGIGGLVAAHAAVLDPRISGVVSVQAPISYSSMLDDPESTMPVSSLLPGVMGQYGVRDVYAAVAPRPLLIVNPQDARRRTVAREQAQAECAWVSDMYDALESVESLRIESGLGRTEVRALVGDWLGSLAG